MHVNSTEKCKVGGKNNHIASSLFSDIVFFFKLCSILSLVLCTDSTNKKEKICLQLLLNKYKENCL